jgi:hypothetical protein
MNSANSYEDHVASHTIDPLKIEDMVRPTITSRDALEVDFIGDVKPSGLQRLLLCRGFGQIFDLRKRLCAK